MEKRGFLSNPRVKTGLIVLAVIVAAVFLMQRLQSRTPSGVHSDRNKTKGSSFANLEIVEFSDFQCPACKRAQEALENILKKYQGRIRVSYHHFPLSGHRWSKIAHQAGECAARQGKFWPYHDRLYAQQETWSFQEDPSPTFIQYAKDTGLNLDRFGACLADEKVTEAILKEKEQGLKLQVASTPSFFIGDKRFVGFQELENNGEAFIRKKLGMSPETK